MAVTFNTYHHTVYTLASLFIFITKCLLSAINFQKTLKCRCQRFSLKFLIGLLKILSIKGLRNSFLAVTIIIDRGFTSTYLISVRKQVMLSVSDVSKGRLESVNHYFA